MSEDLIEIGEEKLLEARQRRYLLHLQGSPLEIARALRDLIETHKWSYKELSEATGISKGQISKYLSLLNLEPEFQRLLEEGRMAWSTGYVLARLPKEHRLSLLEEMGEDKRITLKMAEKLKRETHLEALSEIEEDMSSILRSINQPVNEALNSLNELESALKPLNPPKTVIQALETIRRWLNESEG